MPGDFLPRPARPEERPRAFELLFSHLSAAERDYRVARALDLVEQGELDARGIFVLPAPAGVLGVLVCQVVPGAGALVWPPIVRLPDPRSDEDRLVRHACAYLLEQSARLAQCLLADEELALAAPLLRNGFTHVTGLTYFRHYLLLDARLLAAPACLSFDAFDPTQPEEFHQTLQSTYEQTLDCPEVNGVRTVEEVVQGHQAQAPFDPSCWWLVRRAGEPVGVLILTEPSPGEREVAYMGVVPHARRCGVGREMLLHALCEARADGADQVLLCVDDRNVPARRLYERLGFEVHDHRQVLLAVWAGGADPAGTDGDTPSQ